MSKIEKDIGAHLRVVRLTQKKTKSQVAKKVGVSENQLYKYESGIDRVSVSRLYQIAQALKVSIIELLPNFMKGEK